MLRSDEVERKEQCEDRTLDNTNVKGVRGKRRACTGTIKSAGGSQEEIEGSLREC